LACIEHQDDSDVHHQPLPEPVLVCIAWDGRPILDAFKMVHGRGLEPLRLAAAEPKSAASASFATRATSFEGSETVAETLSDPLRDVAARALGYIEAGRLDLAKDVLRRFLAG
jgi:hypothetical protein